MNSKREFKPLAPREAVDVQSITLDSNQTPDVDEAINALWFGATESIVDELTDLYHDQGIPQMREVGGVGSRVHHELRREMPRGVDGVWSEIAVAAINCGRYGYDVPANEWEFMRGIEVGGLNGMVDRVREMSDRSVEASRRIPLWPDGQDPALRLAVADELGIQLDEAGNVPSPARGEPDPQTTAAMFREDVAAGVTPASVLDVDNSAYAGWSGRAQLRGSRFEHDDPYEVVGGSFVKKSKTGMSMSDYGVAMAGPVDPFASPSVGADWGGPGVRGGHLGTVSSGMVAEGGPSEQFGQPDAGDRPKTFGDDSQFGG